MRANHKSSLAMNLALGAHASKTNSPNRLDCLAFIHVPDSTLVHIILVSASKVDTASGHIHGLKGGHDCWPLFWHVLRIR